jgi:hypothetical protein
VDTHAAIEGLLEAVFFFFIWLVLRLYKQSSQAVDSQCERWGFPVSGQSQLQRRTDIWNQELGARQSPADNDVSGR